MIRPTRNRILSAALAGAGFVVFSLATLPAMAEGSIVVRDFVLSHGIHEREPVTDTVSFRVEDGKAFAFARIRNTGGPTSVSFIWYYGATHHATITLNVGASQGWRTWSTVRLRPGNWRVELVDSWGEVMMEKAFRVGPSSSGPVAMRATGMQGEWGDLGGAEGPYDDSFPGELPEPNFSPM